MTKRQLDNSKVTRVFDELLVAKTRFVVNKGGTASSKSVSSAQKELYLAGLKPLKILVIRKYASTLRESVIASFKARLAEMGMSDQYTENKSERTLSNLMGSVIMFRGLDDPEKLKSIEGVDRVLIEEATELSLEDLYEVNRRLRGREHLQITLNFNPIDERHWLKRHFFDQEVEDCTIVESSYHDNPFLTKKDREQIEVMKKYNYNQYRIYALGEWGIAEVDNPWLYAFDREKHVAKTELKMMPEQTVHLSFDFNINPMCCIAVQHSNHYGERSYIRILKEFQLRNTTVKEACKVIKAAFPKSVLTATGDATGNSRNAGYPDTLWLQIRKGLGLSPSQILTPRSNPLHRDSRHLCNLLLQGHESLLIDPMCRGLINDCLTARPIETDDQNQEDKLLKGAGDSDIGFNLLDCFRYYVQTHHGRFGGV